MQDGEAEPEWKLNKEQFTAKELQDLEDGICPFCGLGTCAGARTGDSDDCWGQD